MYSRKLNQLCLTRSRFLCVLCLHHTIGTKQQELLQKNQTSVDYVHFFLPESCFSKIPVNSDDDIDSIRLKIKTKVSPLLDRVSVILIELYENEGSTIPLRTVEPWKKHVTWGTSMAPLIVKVKKVPVDIGIIGKVFKTNVVMKFCVVQWISY
jgi:hypothetical protein